MRRISINPRFVNAAGNDLIPGKIHTIRANFDFWQRYAGKDVAFFVWEGKPYQKGSKQKVVCVKRIVSVQSIKYFEHCFWVDRFYDWQIGTETIAKNDGFEDWRDFNKWFSGYKPGKMAVLHFTELQY